LQDGPAVVRLRCGCGPKTPETSVLPQWSLKPEDKDLKDANVTHVKTLGIHLTREAMSKKSSWVKKRQSESARAKAQQRLRQRKCLFKKAVEFSLECESDVIVAIRVQQSGQLYIFESSSDARRLSTLSNLAACYPSPIQEVLEDIIPQLGKCSSLDPAGEPASTGDGGCKT
ncbi:hypothetical protein N7471_013064, partial [Penicillium samsonianum]|uniref:uncharacterized protein n=1 Tax=Penicillium samsonianum TaxID=1882272 RepID=UPI002546770C